MLSDYPTADWTVLFVLDGAGQNLEVAPLEIAPASYRFTIDEGAGVIDLPALGFYRWQLIGTSAGTEGVRVIGSGALEVLPQFLNAEGPDAADSFDRRMLALIKLGLEGKVPRDSESYSINGRSISRIPIVELQGLLTTYERRVEAELQALEAGVQPGRKRRLRYGFGNLSRVASRRWR